MRCLVETVTGHTKLLMIAGSSSNGVMEALDVALQITINPLISKLLQIFLTILVSTAKNERSFSALILHALKFFLPATTNKKRLGSFVYR